MRLSEKVIPVTEFYVLKLLDRLQGIFRRAGVNYPVLRSILQVKLTMDSRRTPTVLAGQRMPRRLLRGHLCGYSGFTCCLA